MISMVQIWRFKLTIISSYLCDLTSHIHLDDKFDLRYRGGLMNANKLSEQGKLFKGRKYHRKWERFSKKLHPFYHVI